MMCDPFFLFCCLCFGIIAANNLHLLAGNVRHPVAATELRGTLKSLRRKCQIQTECTRALPQSDRVVCEALTSHSGPRHLEAMIEGVGGL